MKYEKHVFICTNQRAPVKRDGEADGLELVKAFKKLIKDKGLNTTIRAQKAGCLDVCELGPAMVVYPEGVFYGNVQLDDVTDILMNIWSIMLTTGLEISQINGKSATRKIPTRSGGGTQYCCTGGQGFWDCRC